MTRFEIVPGESRVWVHARSTLHPIDSESSGLAGFFEADLDADGRIDLTASPPKARVEMPVERLSSGNLLYDVEMRRRVDARRWPLIEGELTGMEPDGAEGSYAVSGEVTFRGVSRPCSDRLAVSVPEQGTVCLEGSHTFDLRDFGFEPPRIMMIRVHPHVEVRVKVVARA
ncbi:MAG TPA: YceI family protein [Acidimicrobiales bacterium]|nr:YceI family protein [Acidimicrobiales bacterium]